ncbi:transposase [Planctomycetota bacterium]|nr:transposase [Planctomycetota bacterium]
MTAPRWLLPGKTYLLTRRCTQRQLLLAPTSTVREVFRYCLAQAASKFGVEVHAVLVMSNHFHVVATDPRAELPRFMHWLDLHVARAMNVHHRRGENFWSNAPFSAVVLGNADSVLDKIVYTLANPIEAGLVAHLREWPGVYSKVSELAGGQWVADRPGFFFRQKGKALPEAVRLTLRKPPQFADLSPEAFRKAVSKALKARVRAIKADRGERGLHGFLGRQGVLSQVNEPFRSAGSTRPDRGLCPRLACRDKWRRIELATTLVAFYNAYRDARDRWLIGEQDVVFPAGTYWLRVAYGVVCGQAPAPT